MSNQVNVRFGADTRAFERGSKRVQNQLGGLKKAFGALAGIAGVSIGVQAIRGMVDEMDRIGKLSTRLGVTAEEFQKLARVAELGGSDAEEFAAAMGKAAIAAERAGKSGALADAFASLKIDPEQFISATMTDRVQMIADGMKMAGNQGEKFNAIVQILGRSGLNLIPAFEGFDEAARAAMENAATYSNEAVQAAQDLNDALTELKAKAASGVMNPLVTGILNLIDLFKILMAQAKLTFATIVAEAQRGAGSLPVVGRYFPEVSERQKDEINDLQKKLNERIASAGAWMQRAGLRRLPGASGAGEEAPSFTVPGYEPSTEDIIGAVGAEYAVARQQTAMQALTDALDLNRDAISSMSDTVAQNEAAMSGKSQFDVIADSLQRIGGGGRSSVSVNREFAELQKQNDSLRKSITILSEINSGIRDLDRGGLQ
jgi:hypothetical protein